MLDRLCHSDLLCLLNRDRGPARLGQLQQVLPQLCQVSVDQATVVNSPDLHQGHGDHVPGEHGHVLVGGDCHLLNPWSHGAQPGGRRCFGENHFFGPLAHILEFLGEPFGFLKHC